MAMNANDDLPNKNTDSMSQIPAMALQWLGSKCTWQNLECLEQFNENHRVWSGVNEFEKVLCYLFTVFVLFQLERRMIESVRQNKNGILTGKI